MSIDQLEKKNNALGRLIAKEKNPTKKKSLLKLKGKQNIELIKRHQALKKALEKDGVKNLDTLKNQLKNQKVTVDKLFKEALKQTEDLQAKIAKPAYKLMAELLQKQASKRLLSLVMKAVPGLNVISLALDIYDAYTLYQDISAAYMDADTELEIDEDLEALANSNVDLSKIPEIVRAFLCGIGAGGRLTELKPKDVEDIETFLTTEFPKGDDSVAFTDFMFKYGDYYYSNQKNLVSNEQFLKSLKTYDLETIAHEGQVVDLEQSGFNDPEKERKTTSIFKTATYTIVGKYPEKIGDEIQLDILAYDYDNNGKKHQVSLPDGKYINLVVVSIPDSETIKLETLTDFLLEVKGFEKNINKQYLLKKESRFIFNVNNKKFTRK